MKEKESGKVFKEWTDVIDTVRIELNKLRKLPNQSISKYNYPLVNTDAIPKFPSLDAAKNKHALICSIPNSGKSKIISSLDIPFASQFKTSATEMRVPIITGLPNRFSELISMYCLIFINTNFVINCGLINCRVRQLTFCTSLVDRLF